MAVRFFSLSHQFLVDVSTHHQHENYSIFDGESVQAIHIPFGCLNRPNQTGAPNAT
jgi:hypothetical protein